MVKHKILEINHLTPQAFIIRFERNGLNFTAGQYIFLGKHGEFEQREYSIYSGEQDDYIEVLIREVQEGFVSKVLKRCEEQEYVEVDGPIGGFLLEKDEIATQKYLFIATGTGISPFRSFIKTYDNLNYTILHGVRHVEEAYEREKYDPNLYTLCTSQDGSGDFQGRVTEYLKQQGLPGDVIYYLCGNQDMIHDIYDMLEEKGIPDEKIHSEIFF